MHRKLLCLCILLMIVMYSLMGCGVYSDQKEIVNNFFVDLQEGNISDARSYLSGNVGSFGSIYQNSLFEPYISLLARNVEYSIVDKRFDDYSDDICYITVDVYYPDAPKVFVSAIKIFTGEVILDWIDSFLDRDGSYLSFDDCVKECCKPSKIKMLELQIELTMIKNDDIWTIEYTRELDEVASCGITSLEKGVLELITDRLTKLIYEEE